MKMNFIEIIIEILGIFLAFIVYKKQFQKKCRCKISIGVSFDLKRMIEVYGIVVKVINTGNLPIGLLGISAHFGKEAGDLIILQDSKRLDVGETHVSAFALSAEQYKTLISKVKNRNEKMIIIVETTIKTYRIRSEKTIKDIEQELDKMSLNEEKI